MTLLIEPEEATEFEVGRYLGFSLEVPDVDEFYRSLKDSIQFSAPAEVQLWGGTMTSVTDLDGNALSVVQVADDV